ncbi:MAG: GAF domain-containing protein, partial [Luteimonas sp.]
QATSGLSVRSQLDLLSQMVEEISGELALEPLLERIIERACKLIGAHDGVIALCVPERDAIRTAASYNIPASELRAEVPLGHGLTGRVLELGVPLRCRYGDLPYPTRAQAEHMNVLGMPICARGKLIGVFGIGASPPRVLDGDDEGLLDLFARHAAIAIDNAQRYAEEQRRASRFALIAQVAAIVASGPDLDSLLQRAADAIHETLEYPNVDIPLIDPDDGGTLVVRVRGGAYKRLIQGLARLSISQGVLGAAVRERRMQLVNDVSRDPRYVKPPGVKRPLAELAIPILHGDSVLGVLNIEGDCAFDELDCVSLGIVAEYLAVAIVNVRLFEDSTRVALLDERQRLARDLHDNVTQVLASMSLITQSLEEAMLRDPIEGARRIARLGELSQLAFADMRGLLGELSPGMNSGRPAPPNDGGDPLPEALQRLLRMMMPAHVHLHFDVSGFRQQSAMHEEAMLRVCQEAVSNAIHHAAPRRIDIKIDLTARHLRVAVSDDGRGMPKDAVGGMGISNMRQRLSELGGRLRILPRRPSGTRIEARLPRKDLKTA